MEDDARKSLTFTLKSRRRLVKLKGRRYWKGMLLQSAHGDTKGTWKVLKTLLGDGREGSAPRPDFSAKDYHRYINEKIRGIRGKTANGGLASFSDYNGPRLSVFSTPTLEEVLV